MAKTYLQTVDILMKGAPFQVQGLELCPVAKTGVKALKAKDGATIFWYIDRVVKWAPDGTVYTWWVKPTLADAISDSLVNGGKSNYYQFNSDGTVFCRYENSMYFWSKAVDASTEEGTPLDIHICPYINGYEYFLEDEECCCERCISCGKKLFHSYYFCSNICRTSLGYK